MYGQKNIKLHCHLLPAPLYKICPHYLTNCTIFEKKKVIGNKMHILIFCTQLLYEKFHNYRRTERDDKKNGYWSSRKVPAILVKI